MASVTLDGQAADPAIPSSMTVEHTQLVTADGKLVCPSCEEARHVQWYQVLELPPKYVNELNIIYHCRRKKGGCGHTFSPGDHRVMFAYLTGQLVPKQEVERLIEEAVQQALTRAVHA